jgi:hypothetical protein
MIFLLIIIDHTAFIIEQLPIGSPTIGIGIARNLGILTAPLSVGLAKWCAIQTANGQMGSSLKLTDFLIKPIKTCHVIICFIKNKNLKIKKTFKTYIYRMLLKLP